MIYATFRYVCLDDLNFTFRGYTKERRPEFLTLKNVRNIVIYFKHTLVLNKVRKSMNLDD